MNRLQRSGWARWGILLTQIGIMVTAVLGLAFASRPLSGAPNAPPDIVASPLVERQFIGLPDVNTFSIQNISTGQAANITVTTSLSDGTNVQTFFDAIPLESSRIYTAEADLARIESDQQLYGVNFELSERGNDAYLGLDWGDSSPALSQPTVILYQLNLPLMMKLYNGWTAEFTLQNRTEQNATVHVAFYDQAGSLVHSIVDVLIAQNGARTFDLGKISDSDIPAGYIGSVVIASDQAVAVASVRVNNTRGLRSAYTGVDPFETGPELVTPALFKSKDFQTSMICVQNTGSLSDEVIVDYSDGLTATAAINAFGSYCFDQGMEMHAAGWAGGAVIRSKFGGIIAAVVHVTAYDAVTPVGSWMYTAPAKDLIGQALALPLLFANFGQNGGGWTSEIHLYNSNDSPAVVTPRYVSDSFVYCPNAFTIPANSALSIAVNDLKFFSDLGMAYFAATLPVASATNATDAGALLGDTDRHFGYNAAYPFDPISFPDTCNTIYDLFLPVIVKATQ